MSIECKKCASNQLVKNGYSAGKQRYKCKECAYNFVEGDDRQKYDMSDRLKVIKLYLENCGIRTIERLTGVHASQVLLWIEQTADYIRSKATRSTNSIKTVKDIEIMEIDELCTYIKKDPKTAENLPSYGLLLIEDQVKLLILR